ncbi:hypothetical protein DRN93_04195 [archaeon]|nr:MAG: hypothetical protein DRN93_04195 [archaeon]
MKVRSTVVADFLTCPRKAYYAYELGLKRLGPPDPHLFFGQVVHSAIKVLHEEGLESALKLIDSVDWGDIHHAVKSRDVAKSLLRVYAGASPKMKIVALEKEFVVKVGSHDWIGRFDGIAEIGGLKYVMEHKTTQGWSFQVKPNNQLIAYFLGGRRWYKDVQGVVVNLLNAKAVAVRRIVVTYGEDEIEEWQENMKAVLAYYKRCRTSGVFPRNPGACTMWFRECEFYPLCTSFGATRDALMESLYEVDPERKEMSW